MSKFLVTALIASLALLLSPAVSSAVPEGITLTWPGGGEGTVFFDGTKHAKLTCDACHVAGLFQTKKDADKMTMAAMKQSRFCGACHNGKRAFSTTDPKKCHACHRGEKKKKSQ